MPKYYVVGLAWLPAGQYGTYRFSGLTEGAFKTRFLTRLQADPIAIFLDEAEQHHLEKILEQKVELGKVVYTGLKKIDVGDEVYVVRVAHVLPGMEYVWELGLLERIE